MLFRRKRYLVKKIKSKEESIDTLNCALELHKALLTDRSIIHIDKQVSNSTLKLSALVINVKGENDHKKGRKDSAPLHRINYNTDDENCIKLVAIKKNKNYIDTAKSKSPNKNERSEKTKTDNNKIEQIGRAHV